MCRTMRPPTIGNEKQSCNTFIPALCAPHTVQRRQPNPFFGNRFAHSYARRRRHHHHADKENGIGRRKEGKWRIGTKVEQIAAVKSDDAAAPPVIPNSKWLAAIATMVVTNCEYSAKFAASFSACILLEGTSYCVCCPCKLLYCTTDYGRPSSSSLPCYSFLSPSPLGWRHSAAADPSLLNRLHCCHLQLLRKARRGGGC